MVTEQAVRFGRESHLVGVLTSPAAPQTRPGVVLINAGMVYRVGPRRLHVRLARALAEQGHACMRFDLSGLGDSTAVSGGQPSLQWLEDVKDAVALLTTRGGSPSAILFGICAGAVRAYEAALVDPRVSGIFLVDCYLYPTWKTRMRFSARRFREGIDWQAALLSRLRGLFGSRREMAGAFTANEALESGSIPKTLFAQGLGNLSQRGAWVAQIMSGENPRLYNYALQFDDGFRSWRLGDRISAHYFPEASHTFGEPSQQRSLIDFVVRRCRGES